VQGSWNITGDTFTRDEDGYFYYQARSDDMIVSSGYNIAGPEVEEALLAHPAVAECAVVGVPDEARGQLVKAFVVLASGQPGGAGLTGQLQAFVKEKIAPYKYPRAIEFVGALPRTATGKVQRYVLRGQQPAQPR
jgi:2-aminobenzoate-CoA ligase